MLIKPHKTNEFLFTELSHTSSDPDAKEQQLRSESEQWDTSQPEDARPDDIPTIDLEAFFTTGSDEDLNVAAEQLRIACEQTGFFSIIGHQVPSDDIRATFETIRQFHALCHSDGGTRKTPTASLCACAGYASLFFRGGVQHTHVTIAHDALPGRGI